ncbi:MAG: cobalamin-binding protein [Gammaproteobacteria bacterium]
MSLGRGWLALLLGAATATAAPLNDDLGHPVEIDLPARRLVSLAPHVTELLYAAGVGDRLVAAVDYSDYPPAARQLPRLGDATRIDLERLLWFMPDLVIAWGSGTPARELAGVRRLGLPLYLSEPHRLEDIGEQLRVFGRLAGTQAVAAQAAWDYERRLAELRRRYAATPPRPVFYQLALRPLLTVNATHTIHAVVSLCGGVNPFAELPELTPRVTIEAVLAARPAAVIHALYPGEDAAETERFWRRHGLAETTRFIAVPGDYIHRATPRILEGVERICEGLAAE